MANFNGPIPGQSLTREPGGSPWEQPPLYSDNNQAIAFYMKGLNKDEKMDQILYLLDQGMPLNTLVESMLTMGVMNGIHTIDTSMLIAPVIHEYLKELSHSADINLVEWNGPDAAQKQKMRDKERTVTFLSSKLTGDPKLQMPETQATAIEKEKASKGLISRRK